MANLGDGNSWRGGAALGRRESATRDLGWNPVERGDVATEEYEAVEPADASNETAPYGANEFTPSASSTFHRGHGLCGGCYCVHNPPCPPCDCAFHNPNVP